MDAVAGAELVDVGAELQVNVPSTRQELLRIAMGVRLVPTAVERPRTAERVNGFGVRSAFGATRHGTKSSPRGGDAGLRRAV